MSIEEQLDALLTKMIQNEKDGKVEGNTKAELEKFVSDFLSKGSMDYDKSKEQKALERRHKNLVVEELESKLKRHDDELESLRAATAKNQTQLIFFYIMAGIALMGLLFKIFLQK